ncbi:MAG: enoyl-CoA hydratase/isomerase family protein [Devosiaceae bacterium]|nr:enoyl-CoA hydratase/isomerase family protein [Devosiaceae bacterium MH13]
MAVSVETHDGLAIVTIDNPPVNAASHAVRSGLMDAIARTEADSEVGAVVLRGAGRTFTAGADVREFDKPPIEPVLADVVLAIEATSKPWVAALHGTVLGGGLELALGCHYRLADESTSLGLPEVTLGLIPGAGGTVRLPRLIAADHALTMVAGGKPIGADKAMQWGLIDKMVSGDLTDAAQTFAHAIKAAPLPQPLAQRQPLGGADYDALERRAESTRKRAKGTKAPSAAIEAVLNALRLPAKDALAAERKTFLDLKADPQCAALRHIFFAERSSGKLPELKDIKVESLTKIGVIGGGTMGAGIAAACLLAGLDVSLIERDEDALEAGKTRITGILSDSHRRGLLDDAALQAALGRLTCSTSYSALADAQLIIEAVFEDMDVKAGVLSAIDAAVGPEAVIATNTSYLDIAQLAASTAHPERVIGLHFFSPAHIMKLLEVVLPDGVSPHAAAMGFALGRRLKKIAVPSGVCEGFIGNRIMSAYRRECEYMVEDGAMPWDVDEAMRAFGFPMGIFEMQDLAGLDISWATRKRQAATRDPNQRYVDLGDKLCEADRFGRKNGKGWYDYVDGKATKSPWVEELVLLNAKAKNVTRNPISQAEITKRIIDAMQSEARAILAEGIARRPEDVDVVMVNGYGFPRWRGGPMFMLEHPAE